MIIFHFHNNTLFRAAKLRLFFEKSKTKANYYSFCVFIPMDYQIIPVGYEIIPLGYGFICLE